jgi:hypothetical protein
MPSETMAKRLAVVSKVQPDTQDYQREIEQGSRA